MLHVEIRCLFASLMILIFPNIEFMSKAAEFHRQWKTPPKSLEEKRKYEDIRRGDSTRGLERIGRYVY